jgi:hypothetical protein
VGVVDGKTATTTPDGGSVPHPYLAKHQGYSGLNSDLLHSTPCTQPFFSTLNPIVGEMVSTTPHNGGSLPYPLAPPFSRLSHPLALPISTPRWVGQQPTCEKWACLTHVSLPHPFLAKHQKGIGAGGPRTPNHLHPTPSTQPRTQGPETRTHKPGPWTLNPAPCTLHPAPSTLDPGPWTLDPGPWILDPRPSTLHSEPCTLNPIPPGETCPCNFHPSGWSRASALARCLISLVGVKWSCLRIDEHAFLQDF